MSLYALTRTFPTRLSRCFSTNSIRRNSSSVEEIPPPPRRKGRTPRVNPKTQPLLPPHKLRALVSLYHQSDDFITPENLLERIDAAFINDVHDGYQSINRIRHEQYDTVLDIQQSAPKMSPWDLDFVDSVPDNPNSRSWSETVAGRERQIIEALYGVESPTPNARPLPGFETLMEARELLQKQKAESMGEGAEESSRK